MLAVSQRIDNDSQDAASNYLDAVITPTTPNVLQQDHLMVPTELQK